MRRKSEDMHKREKKNADSREMVSVYFLYSILDSENGLQQGGIQAAAFLLRTIQ